jgi:hypothetical protein
VLVVGCPLEHRLDEVTVAMPAPLPEFLRRYGELIQPENAELLRALVSLLGLVVVLLVVLCLGAVVQGAIRWWRRANERGAQDRIR